jgi:hypothetical protein
MRNLRVSASIAAALSIAACGGGSSGGNPSILPGTTPDAGPVVTPPVTRTLTLAVVGDGAITGGTSDCSGSCSQTLNDGQTVTLTAVAGNLATFTGWQGDCTGTGPCTLTMSADHSVTAFFVAGPLPPQPVIMHTLTVSVTGQGVINSSPAGIACPSKCSATFADGAHVTLTGDGATFSGACTGATCSVTMNADATVAAAFAIVVPPPPPPPPASACDKLMPSSLPAAVVPAWDCGPAGCTSGTSDDGSGNFALGAINDSGAQTFPVWQFVQMKNGAAVLGQEQGGTTDGNFFFSEPSGFSHYGELGGGGTWIENFRPDGTRTNAVTLARPGRLATDPAGGFSWTDEQPDSTTLGAKIFTWARWNGSLQQQVAPKQIFRGSTSCSLMAAGMTTQENTLLFLMFVDPEVTSFSGLWVDKSGNPGAQFRTSGVPSSASLQFLLGGGLLERNSSGYSQIWKENANTPSPLPSWLAVRASGQLFPIREGAGYAMTGTCNGVEVLTTDGTSCGCVEVPNLSANSTIGRDGSLIIPSGRQYELYPLLFH